MKYLLLAFVVALDGCAVTHEWGERPKLEIANPYADKTKLRLKSDAVILYMEWDI